MNDYIWNDIKERAEEIEVFRQRLEDSNIVLFGVGINGNYAYKKVKEEYAVYAFADNNQELWGGIYKGISVVSPEKLKEITNCFMIITTSGFYYIPIKKQLKDMGIDCITYMEYVLIHHYDELERVYFNLLEDEFSKKTYLHILMAYLTCDMTCLKDIFVKNQYFEIPEFYIPCINEVFVDCGAYVGDTLEKYINIKGGTFKKIYCFEPTEKTFHALNIRKDRLLKEWALEEKQIVTEEKIVASKKGIKYFIDNGNGKISNRSIEEKFIESKEKITVSLDEYFADKEEKPTFIKADIEGEEVEMLEGAAEIITERIPLLAICVYHKIDDLYEIPIFIKKLNPKYKMAIRHHTPSYWETVLYCYS